MTWNQAGARPREQHERRRSPRPAPAGRRGRCSPTRACPPRPTSAPVAQRRRSPATPTVCSFNGTALERPRGRRAHLRLGLRRRHRPRLGRHDHAHLRRRRRPRGHPDGHRQQGCDQRDRRGREPERRTPTRSASSDQQQQQRQPVHPHDRGARRHPGRGHAAAVLRGELDRSRRTPARPAGPRCESENGSSFVGRAYTKTATAADLGATPTTP